MLIVTVAIICGNIQLKQASADESSDGGSLRVNENFRNASVSDSRWLAFGAACLTAADSGPSTNDSSVHALEKCAGTSGTADYAGKQNGYLQLTENWYGQTGTVLYNRAIPASAGLDIQFYQYQFKPASQSAQNVADGIGFFLTDGSYTLDKQGPAGGAVGGALGYGSIYKDIQNPYTDSNPYVEKPGTAEKDKPFTNGIDHGVLGLGLDQYGNFSRAGYVGVQCPGQPDAGPSARLANSVSLRGPGNGTSGYCLLSQRSLATGEAKITTAPPLVSDSGQNTGTLVHVTISTPDATGKQQLNVTLTGADGTITTVVANRTVSLPKTIKMGFSASTGSETSAHFIRMKSVRTIKSFGAIKLDKTVDHSDATGTAQTVFAQGDHIPYAFVVTNTGNSKLSNIHVDDISKKNMTVVCPATSLAPADSMVCTASYAAVTVAEAQTGVVNNSAKVMGTTPDGGSVTDTSSAVAPTYALGAINVTKVLKDSGLSGIDAKQQYTVSYSYPSGTYRYCTANGTVANTSSDSRYPAVNNGTIALTAGSTKQIVKLPVGAVVTLSENTGTLPTLSNGSWASPQLSNGSVTVGCGNSLVQSLTVNNAVTDAGRGGVLWEKHASDGAALLGGSKWKLTNVSTKQSTTIEDNDAHDTDKADGKLQVGNLAWGNYQLVETQAPQGYQLDSTPHSFSINATTATVQLGSISNTRITGSVSWSKAADDKSQTPLAGSVWYVSNKDTGAVIVVSDRTASTSDVYDVNPQAGRFTVENLPIGTYELKEKTAPAGYQRITAVYGFSISSQNLHPDVGVITNAKRSVPPLPLTGGTGTDIFLFSGLAFLMAAAVWTVRSQYLRRLGRP